MAARNSSASQDGPVHDHELPSTPQQEAEPFVSYNGPPTLPPVVDEIPIAEAPGSTGQTAPTAPVAAPQAAAFIPAAPPAVPKEVDEVLYSDIGINTLLNRLKQSVSSARDFAAFLKKRATLEDEQAQGLRKLARTTVESIRRSESRQGSYAFQLAELTRAHERMAENGVQFSLTLQSMNESLTELFNNIDRGRKHWKTEGVANERKVKDAEAALQKAKARYDGLAEDYDRARTGDRSGGKVFGLKGPKSAAQHEEDLLRKVQNADSDYAQKVQAAQSTRQENLASLRPQAIKALQELISECDSALTSQLQKFAMLNEKLILSNGVIVSPVRGGGSTAMSMRDMVASIANDRDFHGYVSSQVSQVPPRQPEIRYEKHPSLAPQQQTTPTAVRSSGPPSYHSQAPATNPSQPQSSFSVQPQAQPAYQAQPSYPVQASPQSPKVGQQAFVGGSNYEKPAMRPQQGAPNGQAFGNGHPAATNAMAPQAALKSNGVSVPPPTKPVFGVNLDDLYTRDGSAVPMVVYQCIQAVDSFGLEVEGIYRLSGNANHINQLKSIFDHDAARVDFRNPESFHHDVNSVAGLLKQFLRDLPDPLLTSEHYNEFIEAARTEEPVARRDALHAVINSLPDPNYATLRSIILHLNRIQERSQVNRMNTSNLAICIAPSMMGPHKGPRMADAGLQSRVIDTIIQNTFQIFDED